MVVYRETNVLRMIRRWTAIERSSRQECVVVAACVIVRPMTTPGIRRVVAGALGLTLLPMPALAQPAAAEAPAPPAPPPAPATTPNTATPAAPAPAGADEVLLKNGGMLRGDVIELMPDDHVTILVGGERREIPWGEVETVTRGKYAPEPAPAAPPTRPTPPPKSTPAQPTQTPSSGKPRVHLEVPSGRSVEMQRIVGGLYASGYGASMSGVTWQTVCASPCDRVVDGSTGVPFVLGDSPIVFSKKFKLNDRSGDVHIDVKPGRPGVMILGAIATGLGIAGAAGGPVFIFLDNDAWRRTGIAMTAVGVPLLAAGIAMLVLGRTRFEIRD